MKNFQITTADGRSKKVTCDKVVVIDGHLHCLKADESVVAVYAPGEWSSCAKLEA